MGSLELGVVGLGGMGYKHANTVEAEGHDVVAGSDVQAEARDEFAAEFDATTYEEYEEMYEAEPLDGVFVTAPNWIHAPAVVPALERDIAVLVEKPLAHTLEDATRIAETAQNTDAAVMVGFHNRFSTVADVFTAYRDQGRFGSIDHVSVEYIRRRGIPGVGSWFTDRDAAGGGALIDIGVHALDFGLHLLDFPEILEVGGETRSRFGDDPAYANPDQFFGDWSVEPDDRFDVDDSATAFFRLDGATLSLDVAWASNREPSTEIIVDGREAGAKMGLGGDELTIYDTGREGTDHFIDAEVTGTQPQTGHQAEVAYFLECIDIGRAPEMNTVKQAMTVQRAIDYIYRSSDAGETLSFD
jgi:predicted dehydrogenase